MNTFPSKLLLFRTLSIKQKIRSLRIELQQITISCIPALWILYIRGCLVWKSLITPITHRKRKCNTSELGPRPLSFIIYVNNIPDMSSLNIRPSQFAGDIGISTHAINIKRMIKLSQALKFIKHMGLRRWPNIIPPLGQCVKWRIKQNVKNFS